jgi:hypothetical protein
MFVYSSRIVIQPFVPAFAIDVVKYEDSVQE